MHVKPSKKTTVNLDYYIQSSYPPESEGKRKTSKSRYIYIKKKGIHGHSSIPALQKISKGILHTLDDSR